MAEIMRRLWMLAMLGTFWLFVSSSSATEPPISLSSLRHDVWDESKGAPHSVDNLAQTRDGWIWLATTATLTRFDGLRFYPFVASNGNRPLYQITSLFPGENGHLYIGYAYGGVSVIVGERLEHIVSNKVVNTVYKLAMDDQGALWIAAANGLFRYQGDKVEKWDAARGYAADRAEYVHMDGYGRIWVASGTQLFLLDASSNKFIPLRTIKSDSMIIDSPDHRVWLIEGAEMTVLPAPPNGARLLAAPGARQATFQSTFDKNGNFVSGGCPVGICRVSAAALEGVSRYSIFKGKLEKLDKPWQISGLSVGTLFEDREGNIWVGTTQGLDRFKQQTVHMLPNLMGQENLVAVAGSSGLVWATSVDSANIRQNFWRIKDGIAIAESNPLRFTAVAEGLSSLLLAGAGGIERRRTDGTTLIPLPKSKSNPRSFRFVQRVFEDGRGLRVNLQGEGEFLLRGDTWEQVQYGPSGPPTFTSVDAKGRVFEGFRNNLMKVSDGTTVSEFGPQHGIDVSLISFIQTSPELLISGVGGLQVWKDNRFRMIKLEDSGDSPHVSGIVVAADGTHWINSGKGLLQVAPADWQRSMQNPEVALRARLLNGLYGYIGGAEVVRRERTAFRTPDGGLWLVSSSGIGWLNPDQLRSNPVAPEVQLLAINVGGATFRPGDLSTLAAGTTQMMIHYTALSYTMPEKVKFRYRLHGQDQVWQDVGTRREAIYTNLGPGTYRFEVIATNEDGLQGVSVSSPTFNIPPTFTQSIWFVVLVAMALIAMLALAYRLRVTQLTQRTAERTRVQMQERERIARTLHDTFLQNVYGLLLQVQAAIVRMPSEEPARAALEQALAAGDRTLDEGRHQVRGLRQDLPDGSDMLAALWETVASLQSPGWAITIEGEPPPLDCYVAAQVFSIVREALINAVRHSSGTRVEVRFHLERLGLRVTVIDDGKGIGDGANNSPAGHFGIQGMRERAASINATLTVVSAPSQGTTIVLQLHSSLFARVRLLWRARKP